MKVNNLGIANLVVILALIGWYLTDAFFTRQSIYRLFGDIEGPLRPEIRLWRKILLLTLVVAGLASAGVSLYPPMTATHLPAASISIPPDALRALFVLVGAYIAAIGWLYTTFEKEKSDRASSTLDAIRDQLYGDNIKRNYLQLVLLTQYIRSKHGLDSSHTIPLEFMDVDLIEAEIISPLTTSETKSLEATLDQFLNALNQLALGVRTGQFDLKTINLVLRPRFVRYAYVFSEYIRKTTNATMDTKAKRWRSNSLTWEHFLWITTQLKVFDTDNVSIDEIILPPHSSRIEAYNLKISRKSDFEKRWDAVKKRNLIIRSNIPITNAMLCQRFAILNCETELVRKSLPSILPLILQNIDHSNTLLESTELTKMVRPLIPCTDNEVSLAVFKRASALATFIIEYEESGSEFPYDSILRQPLIDFVAIEPLTELIFANGFSYCSFDMSRMKRALAL